MPAADAPPDRVPDVSAVEALVELGRAAGLDAVGVAPAEPFTGTRQDLHERKARGLHGGMNFTYRNPDRSTDPGRALQGARALVVGARSYLRTSAASGGEGPHGRVARYSWEDHYAGLRAGLEPIAARLRADGWRARVVADDNALVDREAARRAGLGWYGKNANLLLPGAGSWFVLGSVITDAPLPAVAPEDLPADGCGSCSRCLDSCPTGAIVEPGVVDARRCLAWLVQATGEFPREYRVALGDRIYGCDDCQEVCPPNRVTLRRGPAPPAREEPGTGTGARVDLVEMLSLDDDELLARYGRWYVPGREARYLRRNVLVALGNVGRPDDPRVEQAVKHALAVDDVVVRSHAVWAARRLGREQWLADVPGVLDDPSPEVREELEAHVTPCGN